jgi:hypothetical protein
MIRMLATRCLAFAVLAGCSQPATPTQAEKENAFVEAEFKKYATHAVKICFRGLDYEGYDSSLRSDRDPNVKLEIDFDWVDSKIEHVYVGAISPEPWRSEGGAFPTRKYVAEDLRKCLDMELATLGIEAPGTRGKVHLALTIPRVIILTKE